jgi:hypothetical protein
MKSTSAAAAERPQSTELNFDVLALGPQLGLRANTRCRFSVAPPVGHVAANIGRDAHFMRG